MTQTRRWTVGTAVAVVVILVAGWFLLAKPQKSKVSSIHEQTASQQQANSLLLTKISALQAEQKQLPQQQLILQKFSTLVPDTSAEPTLIRQLSSAAAGAGVELSAITPGSAAVLGVPAATGAQSLASSAPAATATLYELPITLSINGTYANIESFFNSLERLPRALLVQTFGLTPGTGGQVGAPTNQLNASLAAAVFFAPGTAPVPVVTPSAAATGAPAPTGAAAPAGTPGSPPAVVSSIQASEPPLQVPNG